MTRQPGPMRRLLAFFDPLLGRAPLIIETHYRPAGQAQVRDDKANSRKQLSEVELHLRHHPPRRFPTGCLVEKLLYQTTGLWPGLPTGRVSSSAMSRSRLSLAGMRIAYITPRSSSAS